MTRKRLRTFATAITSCAAGTWGYLLGRSHGSDSKTVSIHTDEKSVPVSNRIYLELESLLNGIFPLTTVHAKSVPAVTPEDQNVPQSGSLTPSKVGELVKYGFPSMDNLRSYQDFMLSYDKRNRTANWVLEHLTPEKVNKPINDGADRSKIDFREDDSIHLFHRSTNKDYKGSGYDRGHLAAAANHRQSQSAMAQTFILSNVAPQVGEGFNRSAWNNLEKYVRAIARKSKNVYVCTGPLYLPRREPDGKLYVKYEVIGSNHVSVPTHFFKVLVIENEQGHLDLQSYVMPNERLPDVKLHSYLIPLDTIERAAGLNFFPNIPKSTFRKINSKSIP